MHREPAQHHGQHVDALWLSGRMPTKAAKDTELQDSILPTGGGGMNSSQWLSQENDA